MLASLHTLEVQHAEWQRQLETGLKPRQQEIADMDARTRLFRAFESTFIPGLLQTAEYVAPTLPEARGLVVVDITDRAAVVSGLETEQPRYYLVAARLFVRLATLPDTRPLSLEELRGQPSGGGDDEAQALF